MVYDHHDEKNPNYGKNKYGFQKEDLIKLYLLEKKSMKDIGLLFKCNPGTIRYYLIRYNIPIKSKRQGQLDRHLCKEKRNQGRVGEKNPNYKHGFYIDDRKAKKLGIIKKECEFCLKETNLEFHHKDCKHWNNILENLQILCSSCHKRLHRQLESKRGINHFKHEKNPW
jgi:5-methylcytosine-specific restriction endonuclease McrA